MIFLPSFFVDGVLSVVLSRQSEGHTWTAALPNVCRDNTRLSKTGGYDLATGLVGDVHTGVLAWFFAPLFTDGGISVEFTAVKYYTFPPRGGDSLESLLGEGKSDGKAMTITASA